MTVAVIGAGMAGAAAANTLSKAGLQVEVFDKGRAAGGRMSSKRIADSYLDLGAQYFTARNELFSQQVSQWLESGAVCYWPAACYRFEHGQMTSSVDKTARFIGAPSMQAPVKALLAALTTHFDCRVSRLRFVKNSSNDQKNGWYLFDQHNNSFGPYQALILAIPPVQLQTLLVTACQPDEYGYSELQQLSAQIQPQALLPCWAVSLQLAKPLQTAADAVFVKEGNVSWLARQNSKPGRGNTVDNWLVHFSPQCSALHLQAEPAQLIALAKAELELIFGQRIEVTDALTHRWLYAQINPAAEQAFVEYSAGLKLAIAGDWLLGGRVENAWLSGVAAAKGVLADV